MCGICGVFNYQGDRPIPEGLLRQMCAVLKHRGPDDEGVYLGPRSKVQSPKSKVTTYHSPLTTHQIGLGIRRLAVIDLKTGHQPIHNEDKTIWMVIDGEIYNFKELKENLIKRGHQFYTKTDAEVLPHLYETYGVECLRYLRGMFAFALWDERNRRLFLAHDRVGKKPLCYTIFKGNLIFASEIKSILQFPDLPRKVNLKAINLYLTYQYIPSPFTALEGINKLPPASYLLCAAQGNIDIQRYWDLNFRRKLNLSETEWIDKITEKLKEAVKIRLVSDVPLGAFLSGGMDSSTVVGLMAEQLSEPVKTFSIGFSEQSFSELKYARIVAKRFGTDHHELVVKPKAIDILPKLVWHYGEPFADPSAVPTYYVAQITRPYVTVALNGDGGDENFAGYLRQRALKLSQQYQALLRILPTRGIKRLLNFLPAQSRYGGYLNRFFSSCFESPAVRNISWHCCFDNCLKNRLYSQGIKGVLANQDCYQYLKEIYEQAPADQFLDQILYTDISSYLSEDYLVKMDMATMANSLEARSPFLDQEFLELTAQIPPGLKIKGLTSKYILKRALKKFLPPPVVRRKKMGFGMPISKWFREELKEYLYETIFSSRALQRGYFDKHTLQEIYEQHISGHKDYGGQLWALLILELWHQIYIDRK